MKVELCVFSGYKIHPGHGTRITRLDGKTVHFLGRKSCSLYFQRKNPRKVAWTVLYRRKMKEGITVSAGGTKKRKVAKVTRAVGTLDVSALQKLRSQTTDFRKLQRETAIKKAKEAKATAAKAKAAASGGKPKQAKVANA